MKQFLYKIRLAEAEELVIGELKSVAKEAVRTAPDLIDLIERRAHKIAARGEKQIEVFCLADAEGH